MFPFNLFRRREAEPEPQKSQREIEQDFLNEAHELVERLNEIWPHWPKGMCVWTDYSQKPPRLIIQQRVWGDRTIHPEHWDRAPEYVLVRKD